jgi:hypothetical protein
VSIHYTRYGYKNLCLKQGLSRVTRRQWSRLPSEPAAPSLSMDSMLSHVELAKPACILHLGPHLETQHLFA